MSAQSSSSGAESGADDGKTVEDPASPVRETSGEWSAGRLSTADAEALASRFKASWETDDEPPEETPGGNGASAPTASAPTASAPAEEAGAWSAGAGTASAGSSDVSAAAASAPVVAPAPRPAPVAPEPSVVVDEMRDDPFGGSSADTTGPAPAIPVGTSSRTFVLGALGALAVVGVVVFALTSGSDSEPEPMWETESAQAPSTPADQAATSVAPSEGERAEESAPSEGASAEAAEAAEAEAEAEAAEAAAAEAAAAEAAEAEAAEAAEAEAAEAEAAAAAAAAAPTPPPEPATVRLRLRTTPASATLSIDGRRVDNPYRAEHREGTSVRVEVAANGYQPHTGTVELDRDRTLNIRLQRAARTRVAQQPRTRPTQMRARTRPTQMRATATATAMRGAGFVTDNPY
jgi:hypothetical protein